MGVCYVPVRLYGINLLKQFEDHPNIPWPCSSCFSPSGGGGGGGGLGGGETDEVVLWRTRWEIHSLVATSYWEVQGQCVFIIS